MSLKEKVEQDIKAAMKARDMVRLETLRSIKAAILLAETEKGAPETLSEEREIALLTKEVKRRREAAEQFRNGNRPELAEKEEAEAKIIEEYLPKPLTEAELIEALKEIINEVGATSPKDFGKVMGIATKRLQGKADNKVIAEKVKQLLG
ncbi:MAG: GatB/YqeY domain-containing protein [Bacteroidia bacterium]|nr:GatB/YqeY domain-containing protein [Bacteroidia bacterium]MDW8302014.1 GatB/YqeY domain-containing protein [Bacteroidia bacterium]